MMQDLKQVPGRHSEDLGLTVAAMPGERARGGADRVVRLRQLQDCLAAGLGAYRDALRRWQTWARLGWSDFQVAHRRTFIGPLWQIIQVGVWVVGLTLVFRQALAQSYPNYLAYVAVGVVLWNFMSASLTQGAQAFVRSAGLIRNVNNPILIYPFRVLMSNLTKLAFQLPVFFLVLPATAVTLQPSTLLVIPGLLLVLLTAAWATPLLALIGVRYRDTHYAFQSIMRFLFFATPVFWLPTGLGKRTYLASFNPFTHYLDVVRAPLLGHAPALTSWLVVGAITAVGSIVTVLLLGRYRREIVFWL